MHEVLPETLYKIERFSEGQTHILKLKIDASKLFAISLVHYSSVIANGAHCTLYTDNYTQCVQCTVYFIVPQNIVDCSSRDCECEFRVWCKSQHSRGVINTRLVAMVT